MYKPPMIVGKQLADLFFAQCFALSASGYVDHKLASFVHAAGGNAFDKKDVAKFLRLTARQLEKDSNELEK